MNRKNNIVIQTIFVFVYLIYRSQSCTNLQNYCFNCINGASCGNCEYGYGTYIVGGGNYACQPCQNANCLDCSSSNSCTQCGPGFRASSTSGLGICQACLDNHCKNCDNGTNICSVCNNFYRVNSSNDCSPCGQSSLCKRCPADLNVCTLCCCQHGVNITTGLCVSCLDPKCVDCGADNTQCIECDVGYGVENGQCVPCAKPNCLECPFNSTYCQKCVSSYGAYLGSCDTCLSHNCLYCNQTNANKCTYCVLHYGLNLIGPTMTESQCFPCSDPQCWACFNFNICYQCQVGYGLNNGLIGDQCLPCPSICITCRVTNNSQCTSCIAGYYLHTTGDTCIPCRTIHTYCVECADASNCTRCTNAYFANSSGICDICPSYCTSCFNNVAYNLPQCTACQPPYGLLLTTPPICGELCGDYYAVQTACDDQIGVEYDGCNDTCEVMDGFQCRRVNYTSTCSYQNQISMEIVDIVKEEDANSFKLKLKIWPPLYVFKTSDLKGAFFINDPTFTIQSIEFDTVNNELVFKVDYSADYRDKNILVEFIPDQNVDERYYASVNSSTMKLVSLTYNPEWVYTTSKLSIYFFYIIAVMANIAALIGLIGKRLAGLEAMFVYQLAYLSIVWLNCQLFLPFKVISPLKYTNGFHLQGLISNNNSKMISQINGTSYPYPHTKQFGFDESIFVNNFNIFFIFQILALISYVITTIILSRLQKKRAEIYKPSEETVQSLKVKTQIAHTTVARQYSATSLLYIGLINMIYYITCSYLFFSKNQLQVLNISSFGVVALIYLITLIFFCCDPDPFDYFRYAFKKTRIAMMFYYIYPFVLASSVLLLLNCKQTWVSIIPIIIFLPIILIYRPYKQTLENFRSAFNLLVMIFWLSLRTFLEFNNQKRNDAFVFNFINILFLFVVLVISFISLIYNIIYTCYFKEKGGRKDEEKVMEEIDMLNVRDRMQFAKNQNLVFKKLLQPRMNLIEFSNNLRPMDNDITHQYFDIKKQLEQQRISKPDLPKLVEQRKKIIENIKEKMQNNEIQITSEQLHENNKLIYAMQVLDSQNKFIRLKNAKDFTLQLMLEKDQNNQESYINNYNQI